MSKNKRATSHSTANPAVQKIYDRLKSYETVKRMSFGVISPCKVLNGNRRVKIFAELDGSLLLRVRDISSIQDFRIYCSQSGEFLPVLKKELIDLKFDLQENG